MMRRLAATMSCLLLVASGACAGGGSSDGSPQSSSGIPARVGQPERNTTAGWGYDPAVGGTWMVAQTFTVPRDGLALAGVRLWVESASGSRITLELHKPASAAEPAGEPLRTFRLDPLQIEANRELRIEISPPLPVDANTLYSFIVLPQGERGWIQLGLQNTNPYVDGRGFSFDPRPGQGWRPENFDLTFSVDLTNPV